MITELVHTDAHVYMSVVHTEYQYCYFFRLGYIKQKQAHSFIFFSLT